jgi:hypothetical protein
MLIKLFGLLLILIGLALSYFGWREHNRVSETEDEVEWEHAVYGEGSGVAGYGIAFGAVIILVSIMMILRIF